MRISIITCVYKTEQYLRRCFDSIRKQIYTDFEVIVVNDESPDNSQQIIDEYVAKDSRFKCVINDRSSGIRALETGIKEAKCEYFIVVDSDDELSETCLLSLSKVMDKGLDFGFLKYDRVFDRKASFLEKRFKYINEYNIGITDTKNNPEVLIKVPNAPWGKIIRKSFLQNNNINFYSPGSYGDFLFTRSILLCNPKLMYINDTGYIYHVRSGSIMMTGELMFKIFDTFDAIVEFAKTKNCYNDYRDELEYLAFHHIAIGTMYRHFRYKPLMFFDSLKKCRNYLKKYNFKRTNKYIKKLGLFERIYLFMFFSI